MSDSDCRYLASAAKLSESAAGITQPHPNAACILVGPDGRELSSAYQRAQGTTSAEVLAVAAAGPAARGATAYLNLESGDCHGEVAALDALVRGGVSRVVVGMRHPLQHLRSKAVAALRANGVRVDVLTDAVRLGGGVGSLTQSFSEDEEGPSTASEALSACLAANEALLHRAALRRPLSVLKYAMTLDGKIATSMGHSAWVSSSQSRALVFEMRARSDAVIVGGNTVRRDDPRLTTRREGGHTPVRVVMSRTLDLPEDANLWDVTLAPTIVMTQRGARQRFQASLRARGVEVVEFDFLTPESVIDYCHERGFLQVFWECGGTLAAPTISSGVIHKLMAFVAPKIIGGVRAPTPVGELGFVEMTQAVQLADTTWRQVGPDLMVEGYLPSSGGLAALESTLAGGDDRVDTASSVGLPGGGGSAGSGAPAGASSSASSVGGASPASASSSSAAAGKAPAAAPATGAGLANNQQQPMPSGRRRGLAGGAGNNGRTVSFYKAWDKWGSLSNFSPHPIEMPLQGGAPGATRVWPSVEHFYQAHKFAGDHHADTPAVVEAIAAAPSPEEAARIGRRTERTRPELVRRDWPTAKLAVMRAALHAKFAAHAGPRAMLLSTAGVAAAAEAPAALPAAAAASGSSGGAASSAFGGAAVATLPKAAQAVAAAPPQQQQQHVACLELVEASPHDYYWGAGYERTGQNKLGQLLMEVRDELLADASLGSACFVTWRTTTDDAMVSVHAQAQSARG